MQQVKMMFVYANLAFLLIADATGRLITKSGVDVSFNLTFPEAAKKVDEFYVLYINRSEIHALFDIFKGRIDMIYYDNPYKTRVQKLSLTPNGVVFKLQDVTVYDAGRYVCVYPNMSVIPECEEFLIVLGKPSKPVLFGNARVVSGSNLMLSCSSHSTSRPPDQHLKMHYIWRRNDVIVQRNYTSNFTVGQISREDNGVKFSCQTEEEEGLASDWSPGALLDVLYGPNQAVLSPNRSVYNVIENRLFEIACSGDCRPACNASWLDKKGRTVSPVTGNRTALRIRPNRNMTGLYRCDLSNTYGKASTHFSINVMYGPIVNNFTVNNRKNVMVKEMDEVNFTCTGDSNPSPVVTFISDMNSPIVPNSILVPPHGFNSSYTISYVNCSQHGRYNCQVSNSIDTTTDSVDIKVKCGPRQRDLIRQQHNKNTVSWRFSIWAFPMPEENLFFSDETGAVRSITTGDKYQLKRLTIRENIHDYTFLIQNVDSNDFGNYTIMIQNAEGSKTISIPLVEEGSVYPIKQEYTLVAIIVAVICSLLFVVAAICAAVYIKRYKNRKEEREERSVSYLSPTSSRLSSRSNESPYATINMEDGSLESASDIRDDYQHLQSESPNHIYRALYPKVVPGKARHHKCSIICGCLSVQCAIVKQ